MSTFRFMALSVLRVLACLFMLKCLLVSISRSMVRTLPATQYKTKHLLNSLDFHPLTSLAVHTQLVTVREKALDIEIDIKR